MLKLLFSVLMLLITNGCSQNNTTIVDSLQFNNTTNLANTAAATDNPIAVTNGPSTTEVVTNLPDQTSEVRTMEPSQASGFNGASSSSFSVVTTKMTIAGKDETTKQSKETCTINNPFNCSSGGECISRKQFCDFASHCSDGSDEIRYNKTIHQDMGIECYVLDKRGRRAKPCLLPHKYKCDHELDCTLGEDECECNHTMLCDTSPFLRRDKQCIARSQFCDNVKNCFDRSDEKPYSANASGYQCAVTKTRVTSFCMLPTRNVCDGVSDCGDATDECFCDETGRKVAEDTFYNGRCFRCLDKSLVIPRKQLCDGIFHCKDLSDECLCDNKPPICYQVCKEEQGCASCVIGEIICRSSNLSDRKCIGREKTCDETFDCPFHEDESNCNIDFSNVFNCTDGTKYIPKHQRCDNITQCENGSDEMNCQKEFIECNTYYPSTLNTGGYDFARPRYAVPCDKIPTCEDLEDECNKTLCGSTLPKYCDHVAGKKGFICPMIRSALIGTEICDGFPTCFEASPNSSADEMGCPNRFYCHDNGSKHLPIHIPLNAVCDGVSDCTDESDELNCTSDSHFYCSSNIPRYLPKTKVCNGIQDCSDGEDECQDCSTSPFSSDTFLINSYVLQVFIWIVGLFAVFGNIGVLAHNARQFYTKRHSFSVVAFNHRILVTSLALADLLLGFYLIGLGIINSANKGIYCRQDIQWRSSSSCVAIGTMAVISIECSVFLLSIMATMRLFLVTRPLDFRLHRRYIVLGVVCAWFFSFLLALIPLSDAQTDYFTSELWYQHNPFLTLVNRQRVEEMTKYLWALQSNSTAVFTNQSDGTLSWENMIRTISVVNESFVPSLRFGYYSAHGVCLPRIFPDPSADRSWGFSLFLVTLNFLVFIYMICAYTTIYRITVKNSRRAGGVDEDEAGLALQHKISRIIFTNFCCWIPICIMAFISAGGGYVSQEAYAVSAIVLLPINSAFNPLLYSDLPELIWAKFFAHTAFGKWVESKRLTRLETRRKSRASSLSASALRQTELTRFQSNIVKNSSQSTDELSKL